MKKVIINNKECFATTMTVGELQFMMKYMPEKLLGSLVLESGFDLSIISYDNISPELKVILDDADVFTDDEEEDKKI